MGASVTILARTDDRLAALRERFGARIATKLCAAAPLADAIAEADVVIGAVLDRGKLSPRMITRDMLRAMRPGSVLIDVGIDQGGIAETSRQTTISAPTFVAEGIIHYCVPNIPALAPRTASLALSGATLPYVIAMAERGIGAALALDPGLRAGLQAFEGGVTHPGLSADAKLPLITPALC
jgi:alanine dehydrogenase